MEKKKMCPRLLDYLVVVGARYTHLLLFLLLYTIQLIVRSTSNYRSTVRGHRALSVGKGMREFGTTYTEVVNQQLMLTE